MNYLPWLKISPLVILLILPAICVIARGEYGTGWVLRGPTPIPTLSPTPTPPWIDPIIVDNPDATFVGEDWSTGTMSQDKYGSDYRFHYAGDGSCYGLYRPDLPIMGPYEILEWHPQGTNRTNNAEIIIKHADGESTITVNQKTGGGRWNSLGFFNLTRETDCYARITDNFTSTDSGVVMADAFQFAYVNTGPTPTPSPTPTPTPTPSGTVRPFGEYVQEVIDELEYRKATDVSGYLRKDKWGKYTGVTETLWYQGVSYMWNECAPGEWVQFSDGSWYQPYGHSYCSGLTLEIWHRAMKKRDQDLGIPEDFENWNGLGTKGIFIFKKMWNVVRIHYSDTGELVTPNPSPATALEMSGLGRIITYGDSSKFEDVRPYDFCDISRSTATGHSVVFINWVRDPSDDHIIGFRYYSTQSSTSGQGYATEYFQGEGGTVLKYYFHAGRMYDDPRDNTPNQIRESGYY